MTTETTYTDLENHNKIANTSFAEWGKSFQEKIIQALLTDRKWAAQFSEVVNIEYFDKNYLKFLADKYFDYYKQYKTFPTLGLLVTIVKDSFKDDNNTAVRDQIVDFLKRVKTNPDIGDLEYVKEKSLDFCKRQALKAALEKSIEHISNAKYDSVVDEVKRAVSLEANNTIGLDFFEDLESRFLQNNRHAIPTGMVEIDKLIQGGLGAKELAVIVGAASVGKSHMLVQIGANALRLKKNVLHYTFELSAEYTGIRYDSNLCNIPSDEVITRKNEVLEQYKKIKYGRLLIKEYPTGGASTLTLRNHIDRVKLKGFEPNIIIIDYADIMRPVSSTDLLRLQLKAIYEELRGLAQDLDIPILTASQANKEASKSDIVDLSNMSESYAKAAVADLIIAISKKPEEKYSGLSRLFIAKSRIGKDGIVFATRMNTAMSKIEILSESDPLTLDQCRSEDDILSKGMLQKKWNEFKKESKDLDIGKG